LVQTGAQSREEYDQRLQDLRVGEASVNQAREEVYQVRAALGLLPQPPQGKQLTDVPPDLDQTYSEVSTALAQLLQTIAQLGLPLGSTNLTPRQAIQEFRKRDAQGDIDRILSDLIPKVPAVIQARAKLAQARHDLEQAELDLSYCELRSEIDGLVTRRNVNPGNYLQVGQQLMAVHSVREIWIDANFKETQLADLRIGQHVVCEVDMYGGRRDYEGRITGFTMGTGQTLSLLPPQNATGNFVKIVQRLPVRIELTDYDPDKAPLFVGLSVEPHVYTKEPPTGPNAGAVLQPVASPPVGSSESRR
jgi:membrane fusion protein (multidrug efflux system)